MFITTKYSVNRVQAEDILARTSNLKDGSSEWKTLSYTNLSDLILSFGLEIQKAQEFIDQTSYQIELEARNYHQNGERLFQATWYRINEVEVEIKTHLLSRKGSNEFEILIAPLNAENNSLYVNQ